MTRRFVRCATFLSILGAVLLPTSGLGLAVTPAVPPPGPRHVTAAVADEAVAIPPGVEAFVAGDMVVHWIDEAAGPVPDLGPTPGVAVELAVGPEEGDGHDPESAAGALAAARTEGEAVEHHAAAEGGYALFSPTARLLPGGYTIRLTGGDARIEQYRDEVTAAARAASATTGIPLRIAPGFGGPGDPARGEIVVTIGAGPCGPGSIGCGGPSLTTRELVAGRVWVHPSALDLSAAQRANLTAHELGHALGLQHFEGSWTDGRQVMYPVVSGVTSYRTGDGAGLRRVAGTGDRPAGTVTSRTYAAGRAHVTGTVASGTRVRLTAASVTAVVPVAGGRFSGALPLPAGRHVVCVVSLDPGPGFRAELGCGEVDAPGTPVGHLDELRGSLAAVRVTGWALDPQTAGPVRVQVTRNGAVVATIEADGERDDLGGAVEHYGTVHGFDADVTPEPGRNRICVKVLGEGGGGDAGAGCAEIDHAVVDVGDAGPGPAVPDLALVPPAVGGTAATALAVVNDLRQDLTDRSAVPVASSAGGLLTDG